MNITIKEVAKQADVSTATVSRVLNENYPVSDEVRERVLAAVQALEYKPNQVARSLKRNRTNLIGIVVADIANPFFMNVGKGLEEIISRKDYNLIFCSTNESCEKEQEIIDILIEKKVDAVVISVCSVHSAVVQKLLNNHIKVVLIDRKVDLPGIAVDGITNDNFNGSYFLTEYLIQMGHKDIGIMNGLLSTSTARERFAGFESAMRHYGLPLQERFILRGKYNRQDAYAETLRSIRGGSIPSAIICGNNVMAEGVMKALKDCHLAIPQDVSLVSFGLLANQELIEPKITCLDQCPFLMGQKAGEILLELLDSKDSLVCKEVVLQNEFIEGSSVNRR